MFHFIQQLDYQERRDTLNKVEWANEMLCKVIKMIRHNNLHIHYTYHVLYRNHLYQYYVVI